MSTQDPQSTTYLLIDGENIDATLGNGILGRRPEALERPRWERLMRFMEQRWEQPAVGLFFLACRDRLPMPFIQAIMALGYRPIPLSGPLEEKIVDIAIQRTLEAIRERGGDVVLVSNDGDFLPQMQALNDGRLLAVAGFNEFRNVGYAVMEPAVELIDLEYDVQAFTAPLPRLRIIPIEEFDPLPFL